LHLALSRFASAAQQYGVLSEVKSIPEFAKYLADAPDPVTLGGKYKPVAEAAKELGPDVDLLYRMVYPILSKLTHPTAMIIKANLTGDGAVELANPLLIIGTRLVCDIQLTLGTAIKNLRLSSADDPTTRTEDPVSG
jgi:hypothetical protein